MIILRGRYASQTGRLHQFANDWMSVDLDGGRQGVIVRPDQIKLNPGECEAVVAAANVGAFWREWKLNDDGTFTALRDRPTRRSRRQQAATGRRE